MNIIILGAGRVGESVAESLASEQNDITVIDQDPERLRLLEERCGLALFIRPKPGGDIDGDALPDAWEAVNLGGLSQGPYDDSDGDSYNNQSANIHAKRYLYYYMELQ